MILFVGAAGVKQALLSADFQAPGERQQNGRISPEAEMILQVGGVQPVKADFLYRIQGGRVL
ncbi:hypothetical protein CCX46_07650 [Pseudomonas sp. RU47]|nr:hypothetical protein CCX46_07650 [Pseudomonas sp. RU47]QHF49578.1 hypothetical protein PspS49_08015 [Pseudomonas sp. S49]